MFLLQSQAVTVTAPAWAGPVMAVSLALIALSVVVVAGGVVLMWGKLMSEIEERKLLINQVATDAKATMASVRELVNDGEQIVGTVRNEAEAFARTGRVLRKKLKRGVGRMESRLVDLESLYDVVHAEVEDTALDVAAGLRQFRRGRPTGLVGRMTRALLSSRRR
ncbi:MAG TPA: hypothetical protein VFS94_01600 [Gemmatimonadales bacterium]|nr:hypothetical protein [Gemmatimonadales bacterium]